MLSRSSGQVPHVLLTRSPLGLPRCCHRLDLARLACVKHAASVRPEPGSNSPSRSPAIPRDDLKSESRCAGGTDPLHRLAPKRTSGVLPDALSVFSANYCEPIKMGSPALAFRLSVPFSRCTSRAARVSSEMLVRSLVRRVAETAPHFLLRLRPAQLPARLNLYNVPPARRIPDGPCGATTDHTTTSCGAQASAT